MDEYRMPKLELGDTVFWFPAGSTTGTPAPAVVTAVYERNICCNVMVPTSRQFQVYEGCHHVSDPRGQKTEHAVSGGWDYTPQHKRHLLLERRIAELATPPKGK